MWSTSHSRYFVQTCDSLIPLCISLPSLFLAPLLFHSCPPSLLSPSLISHETLSPLRKLDVTGIVCVLPAFPSHQAATNSASISSRRTFRRLGTDVAASSASCRACGYIRGTPVLGPLPKKSDGSVRARSRTSPGKSQHVEEHLTSGKQPRFHGPYQKT